MIKQPLVSIIIPCYNRSEVTIKALESALAQTYANTEIIVVDDGSTDESVKKLSSLDAPFKLIRHQKNKGANAARNTGIKNAKGEWIAFLDSDDLWNQDKIESMMEVLLQNVKYEIAYCSMDSVKNGKIVSTFKALYSGNIYAKLLEKNVVGSASVPLIKKSVIEGVGGLDEDLKSAQDWDLWLRIAEAGHEFLAIQQALVYYKVPDSKFHISGSLHSFWEGRKAFIEKHFDKYLGKHKSALGKVYSDTGFLLLNRFHSSGLARHCFLRAVRYNPLRIKSWKGLFGSLIPYNLYKKLIPS